MDEGFATVSCSDRGGKERGLLMLHDLPPFECWYKAPPGGQRLTGDLIGFESDHEPEIIKWHQSFLGDHEGVLIRPSREQVLIAVDCDAAALLPLKVWVQGTIRTLPIRIPGAF